MAFVGNFDNTGAVRTAAVAGGVTTLNGLLPNGVYKNVPVTGEGHLEVAIHGPNTAFGSVKVESEHPVFQIDSIYGVQPHQTLSTVGGAGTVSNVDGMFTCKTNSGVGAVAVLQSRLRARYRSGQGICARFTARFASGPAGGYQVVGVGHSEDGLYVGYDATGTFGFLYSHHGLRTLQEITITAGASANGSVLINGVACAVTNSANINRTAWEIAQTIVANYAGATVLTQGGTTRIQYVSNNAVNMPLMTFNANGTGATATVSKTRDGGAAEDVWIPQTSWNADKFDGTGNSGVLLDPTKLNVFEFKIQYLGAGACTFFIETTTIGNNPHFELAHVLVLPNTLIKPSFRVPIFPFTMAVYDLGTGTNLTMQSGSAAAFLEGNKRLTGNRGCYWGSKASVTAAAFQPLFTISNPRVYNNSANQCSLIATSINCACDHNNPVFFFMIIEPVLVGNVSFVPYDFGHMLANIDTTATAVTYTDNSNVIWVGMTGSTGSTTHDFNADLEDVSIQPGERITFAARTVSGTAAFVAISFVWREDI